MLSTAQVLLRQFKNPIFAILIACAVIAGVYSDPRQAVIILLMIGISVILGFYNEHKAEKIVENLRQNVAIKAVVTRGGKTCQIDLDYWFQATLSLFTWVTLPLQT